MVLSFSSLPAKLFLLNQEKKTMFIKSPTQICMKKHAEILTILVQAGKILKSISSSMKNDAGLTN